MIKPIKNFLKFIEPVWNWKKYPAGVFITAVPLFILGMGLSFLTAILQLTINHYPWYLVIMAGAIGLLVLGMWNLWKPLMRELKKYMGP